MKKNCKSNKQFIEIINEIKKLVNRKKNKNIRVPYKQSLIFQKLHDTLINNTKIFGYLVYLDLVKVIFQVKVTKIIKNSFKIDGDLVRKTISQDLNYSIKDRIEQNRRVLNLANFIILNGYFPIISSVYLDKTLIKKIRKNKIQIIKIIPLRMDRVNLKLKNKKNVIGKDLIENKIMSKNILMIISHLI